MSLALTFFYGLAHLDRTHRAIWQAIKSTFTRSEKDASIGAVLELKKSLYKVDFTAKVDHKGAANITAEHGPAALPGSEFHLCLSL